MGRQDDTTARLEPSLIQLPPTFTDCLTYLMEPFPLHLPYTQPQMQFVTICWIPSDIWNFTHPLFGGLREYTVPDLPEVPRLRMPTQQ